jgi:hypothetical protein
MTVGRALLDPIYNAVAFDDRMNSEICTKLVEREPLPLEMFATVVHESMHHFCLNSPVGKSLLLKEARLQRLISGHLSNRSKNQLHLGEFLAEMVMHDYCIRFLQPLLEGMAVFAEHDMRPGMSNTVSAPSVWASHLFTRVNSGENPWQELEAILSIERSTHSHYRRKASLLASPLDGRDGGYLPGYLFIKELWWWLIQTDELFSDSDFFIHFVRRWYFDDWALAGILLDRSDRSTFPEVLHRYFDKRTRELIYGKDCNTLASILNAQGTSPNLMKETFYLFGVQFVMSYLGLRSDQILCSRGIQLFRDNLNELVNDLGNAKEGVEAMIMGDELAFMMHSTLSLGRTRIRLGKNGSAEVLTPESSTSQYLHPVTLPMTEEGEYELEVMGGADGAFGMFVAMTDDQKRSTLASFGESPVPEWLQLAYEAPSTRASRREQIVSALKQIRSALGFTDKRSEISKFACEKYIGRILGSLPANQPNELWSALQEDGLFPLLGRNVNNLKELAWLSLFAGSPLKLANAGQRITVLNDALQPILGRDTLWFDTASEHLLFSRV